MLSRHDMSVNQNKNISGFLPVALAMGGNLFITAIKVVGFFISGSGALFSEAVHSFADTLNQSLLMVGLKRSTKKADENFSYGYGQERFLWALISACGIFFLGAGVTVYRGITSLQHPESVNITPLLFGILFTSLAIESATFFLALKELKKHGNGAGIAELVREGDPTTIAVLYEDGVAVLGVFVALVSISMTYLTGSHYWDAVGSIVIGMMLGVVAITLIAKNRSYLIGKDIPPHLRKKIIKIMESDPTIEKVLDFKSSVLDVGSYQIKCEVEFHGPALMKTFQRSKMLKAEYARVKDDYREFVKFFVEYTDRVPRLIGNRIDEIEKKIQKEVPSVKHIDIEIN